MKLRRDLLIVLAVCVTVRIGFLLLVEPWALSTEGQTELHNDSRSYHQLAVSIVERGEFNIAPGPRRHALRTPGYPLFVAGFYALFGVRPWLVMLGQVALVAATAGLLHAALARALGARAALGGALVYALDPILVLYDTALLSEALFCFFLVLVLDAGLRALGAPRRAALGWYALLGLAAGLSAIVRPAAQYLPLFLLPLVVALERRAPRHAVASAAVVLATFVLAISPWVARNHARFGVAGFSTSGPYNLLSMNVGTLEAQRRGVGVLRAGRALLDEADARMVRAGEDPLANSFRRADFHRELAFEHIRARPLAFAYYHAAGTLFLFANLGTSDFARVLGHDSRFIDRTRGVVDSFLERKGRAEWVIAAVVAPLLAVIYALLALGLAVAWNRYDRRLLAWLVVPAAYFVITPGAFAIARFRIPVMVFLVGFAGIGAVFVAERLRARRAALKPAA